MKKRLTRTVVKPTPYVRKVDPEKEGPIVDSAYRFEKPIDLSAWDYVEEEYLIQGEANVYNMPNIHLPPVIVNENCPYGSRIVVRKPRDPKKFSGVVAFESFNGSFTIDHCNAGFGQTYEEIMRSGDAWVGYTKDGNCLRSLRQINPEKYGNCRLQNPLPEEERGEAGWDPMYEYFMQHGMEFVIRFDETYERGLVFDMVFQMIALLKSGEERSPFCGYDVKKAIGIGINDYNTYISGFQDFMVLPDGSPVIDGYLMYMSGGGGWVAYNHDMFDFTDPRCSKTCNVPVIRVETAGDLRDVPPHPFWASLWRCKDGDEPGRQSRWYEIPGLSVTAAFRQNVSCFACPEDYLKLGIPERREKNNVFSYWNQMNWMIYACAFHNLKDWVLHGILPPREERFIELKGTYPDVEFVLDETGNHIGGVRHPYVDVPLGRWTDSAACVLYDKNYRDTLYRDQADYVSRVKASAEKMVKDRWILPSAAEILVEEARNIPW